jgi:hypothetical protein
MNTMAPRRQRIAGQKRAIIHPVAAKMSAVASQWYGHSRLSR